MKTLDLAKLERLQSEEGADWRILPDFLPNGSRPSPLYFKKPFKPEKNPPVKIEEVNSGNAIWTPGVTIDSSNTLHPKDYIGIVSWWFGQMSLPENSYYIEQLGDTYPGINLREALKKVRTDIEHYFTHTTTNTKTGPKYTKRLKRIDQKITQSFHTFEKKGWYSK